MLGEEVCDDPLPPRSYLISKPFALPRIIQDELHCWFLAYSKPHFFYWLYTPV
jgi:hypothetical protein